MRGLFRPGVSGDLESDGSGMAVVVRVERDIFKEPIDEGEVCEQWERVELRASWLEGVELGSWRIERDMNMR